MHLIGIEPISSRYEQAILPLNYKLIFLLKKKQIFFIKNISIRIPKQKKLVNSIKFSTFKIVIFNFFFQNNKNYLLILYAFNNYKIYT